MKKLLSLGLLLAFSGGAYSVSDYLQIGWNRFQAGVSRSIPVDVEIDRLGVSLQQLDGEIVSNGRKLVEESVALDRFTKQVTGKEKGLASIKSDLALLKTKYVDASCDKTKRELEGSMSQRVARFKAQSEALSAMRQGMENKRQALDKMRAAFEQQKLSRDLLQNRLDTLRAEFESMKMQGALASSALESSAVSKATDLALDIEDRLEVQRRLAAETAPSFGDSFTDALEKEAEAFELADVEAVLNETLGKLTQTRD